MSCPLNRATEYAYLLGLSDELKFFRNKKTYPELIFEIADLDYQQDEYLLGLSPEDITFAENFAKRIGLKKGEGVVGLNTGAGDVFANKAWTVEGYIQLISQLKKEPEPAFSFWAGPRKKNAMPKFCGKPKGRLSTRVARIPSDNSPPWSIFATWWSRVIPLLSTSPSL